MRQSNLFLHFFKMVKFLVRSLGTCSEMLSNGSRRILVLVNALMQMSPCVTNITCITQVTFKLINKGLLVDNGRLDFARFQMLFNLVANKYRLDCHLNFLAQIFKLCSYNNG